jgi:hypothetical protein
MLLHVPEKLVWNNFEINLKIEGNIVYSFKGKPGKRIIRLPFALEWAPGKFNVMTDIVSTSWDKRKYTSSAYLLILPFKSNEVKTDRFTGGLIVNKRQFFPFGFYCYSPVYSTLPEEEVVKGFNMMSPYQKILPETFNERKAYMDRCAQLGMKVHYNLLSVSGGGGVGSKIEGISDEQKREQLIVEIKAFRDHPALLAWYISDEPTGNKITPLQLEDIYKAVKENDPWHPVSIVFMAPFLSSIKYANALDIVMADPYPIPNSPLTIVGNVSGQLRAEFDGKKPVWIVPQAFGGGEWWGREPSIQEIRSMTYQAIMNGARGIQYFVRQGLNSFPKSTATWNECGRMALEIAEITPWLLSDEETIPVWSDSKNIETSSALHDGQLLVMAVNIVNASQRVDIRITGLNSGTARVLFENRTVTISSGVISDYLPAYGSQVYMVNFKPRKESILPYRGNLLKDPGFEDISSLGIPASCYAWNPVDRGATYFLDSREHYEGNHSLRLVTPAENKSARLRFFPFSVSNGNTYIVTVWAKTVTEQQYSDEISPQVGNSVIHKIAPPYFEIGLGEFGKTRFIPGNEWQQYVTSVTIPIDNVLPARTNLILQMPGAGVGWFDMLQVFEATDIKRSINPELQFDWK